MYEAPYFDFSRSEFATNPFPHFCAADVLQMGVGNKLFTWMENADVWSLTEAEFYTQYEFSLFDVALPKELQCLLSFDTIRSITERFKAAFTISSLDLADVTAHKLIDGHKIGIHNDYVGNDETHRLVIQVNPSWDDSKGGYLLLFNSKDARDVAKLIKPVIGSAFGFEISPRSYHAVSAIKGFSRYSIVYTFKKS